MIRHLGLSGFFILHRDMLELAREVAAEVRGTEHGALVLPPGRGRGSSVASIVCYLTGLSHIDPLANELHLGRFLNEDLTALPDIDLDFPRDIREVLIPRVHDRYGHDRSALVAAFATYQVRSAVRDFAKALGLPPGEIERLARTVDPWKPGNDIEREVAELARAGRRDSPRWQALVRLARAAGRPAAPPVPAPRRDGDRHPAADRPVPDPAGGDGGPPDGAVGQGVVRRRRLPQDRPARPGDALGGRALRGGDRPHAQRADRPVADRLRRPGGLRARSRRRRRWACSRSRAARRCRCCTRTRPESLDDLTVQVALVRPGPIHGGAVHPYIERKKALREDPDYQVPYEHPSLEPVLKDTLGAIVFQDQVIEVAMEFAGFTAGEAEGLRRAMSRKRSEAAMRSYEENFVAGAVARGVERRDRPARLRPDRGLLGLRLPQVALGGLRAARLPVHLAAGALRARVPGGADERAADGLLPAGHAGARGAAEGGGGAAAVC